MVKNIGQDITPKNDATLGLIFRLNALWAEADIHAKNGSYDAWNNILDRIYCNLLYRENLVIVKDENKNIISMDLSINDKQEYDFLTSQISKYKIMYASAKGFYKKGITNKRMAKSMWFKKLKLKDIWVRKLMSNLNLYIKETTKTPGSAMFGR